MAGLVDAVKNIGTDQWWFPKLLVLSYLTFLIIYNYGYLLEHVNSFYILGGITLLVFMGTAVVMMKRNINNEAPILPNVLNIPEVLFVGFLATVLILPGSILCFFLNKGAIWVINQYSLEGIFIWILMFIAFAVPLPFIFIPLVLYSARGNFGDGYRFDLLIKGGGDFIVKSLVFVLGYGIFGGFLGFLVYKSFEAMLGTETSGVYGLIAFLITLVLFSYFSYISDLYGESIPSIAESKKRKKAKPIYPERKLRTKPKSKM